MFGCDFCGRALTEWDCMTECGHLICRDSCYNENEQVCPICKKKSKFACIGDKVPRNGVGFLTSTRSLLNNAENIIEFRFKAMTNLIEYLRSKIAKQDRVIDQAKHELKWLKYHKSEIYALQQENAYLRNKVQQMKHLNQEYHHDFV